MTRRVGFTILLLLALVISVLKPVDRLSAEMTDTALRNAAVTYATARLINGAISVLKGTEVGLAVGGTVTFSVGEILDPLHDLIEQLSLVLLIALTSLGVQKVLIVMLSSALFSGLLVVVTLLLTGAIWLRRIAPAVQDLLFRAFVLLLFARFSMVLIVLANQLVYDHYLAEKYHAANTQLTVAGVQLEQARIDNQPQAQAGQSWDDSLLGVWERVRAALDPAQRLSAIRQAAEQTLEQAISLITVFVMQTILLPLLFALMFYQIARALARVTYRTWISGP